MHNGGLGLGLGLALQTNPWCLESSSQAGPAAPGLACWPVLAAVESGCPGK